MKISAAMATYNGERYILEQLESLVDQTRQPDEVVICDDGSTDNTVEVIKTFAATAPFQIRLYENKHNLGYSDNFLKAAKLCTGDWVAFCDQDDVWLPNKISDAACAIERDARASLILQNAYICDANLTHNKRLFPASIKPGLHASGSQYGFWVWPGFLKTVDARIFQNILLEERPLSYFPKDILQTHDKWTCMIANALGRIAVLDGPAALYRRHENALTGEYRAQSVSDRVDKAMAVGNDHYAFLSSVAQSEAQYLDRAADACENQEWADKLRHSALGFRRISVIQSDRGALYEADRMARRFQHLVSVFWRGGYIGPRFTAMGWKSLAKDFYFTIRPKRKKSVT